MKRCPVCKMDLEEDKTGNYKCKCGYIEVTASTKNTLIEKEYKYTLKAHAYIAKAVKELENLECKCNKQGRCGKCIAIINLNGINNYLN